LGVSKRVRDDMTQYNTSIRNNFEAPEMIGIPGLGDDEHYTNAVDIWALGYLMYWMLTLELPFPSNRQLFLYCMQESVPALPRHHLAQHHTSDNAIEFLAKLLRPQPEIRPTAVQILTQTWLSTPTTDESGNPGEALKQDRTVFPGKVVERPWPDSQAQEPPVRNNANAQTEPEKNEATEESAATTEARISEITRIPMVHVNENTARSVPSMKPITHANERGEENLRVTIIAVDGLYKRDVFRFPDPFAVASISGEQVKTTSVIKKTLNPYWNEVFDMRATEDSILVIQIFDQKKFRKKDQGFLGVINIRVGDIIDLDIGGDGTLHAGS
jgi:serine/threonine protein kinase